MIYDQYSYNDIDLYMYMLHMLHLFYFPTWMCITISDLLFAKLWNYAVNIFILSFENYILMAVIIL